MHAADGHLPGDKTSSACCNIPSTLDFALPTFLATPAMSTA